MCVRQWLMLDVKGGCLRNSNEQSQAQEEKFEGDIHCNEMKRTGDIRINPENVPFVEPSKLIFLLFVPF